jgi:hypothetical protein
VAPDFCEERRGNGHLELFTARGEGNRRHAVKIPPQPTPVDIETIVTLLKARHANDNLPPPVSETDFVRAEGLLGFPLPPLLQSLYIRLSDGGFGPSVHPLFTPPPHIRSPRDDREGAIDLYLLHRESTSAEEDDLVEREYSRDSARFAWPPFLVPLCDWGCAIGSAVDCSKPNFPVLRADANRTRFINRESPSLSQWFEDWLNGKDLFYRA